MRGFGEVAQWLTLSLLQRCGLSQSWIIGRQGSLCFSGGTGKLGRQALRGTVLGGSGHIASKVTSTLIGVISNCKYSYRIYNPSY